MKPLMYTTHCPVCKVLAKKMIAANIEYDECTDESIMRSKNIDAVPVLEIDGKLLSFKQAVEWVNERNKE